MIAPAAATFPSMQRHWTRVCRYFTWSGSSLFLIASWNRRKSSVTDSQHWKKWTKDSCKSVTSTYNKLVRCGIRKPWRKLVRKRFTISSFIMFYRVLITMSIEWWTKKQNVIKETHIREVKELQHKQTSFIEAEQPYQFTPLSFIDENVNELH